MSPRRTAPPSARIAVHTPPPYTTSDSPTVRAESAAAPALTTGRKATAPMESGAAMRSAAVESARSTSEIRSTNRARSSPRMELSSLPMKSVVSRWR